MASSSRQTNPIQDLFEGIKKILEFMEVKDINTATSYETTDIRDEAEMWMAAKEENDTYITYKNYWKPYMFQEIVSTCSLKNIQYWMEHPRNVPANFRENLLTKGRAAFLESYVEKNDYYRMLNGLPPIDTPESEYVYLSEAMRNQLNASDEPLHQLSDLIQNDFMGTDEYQQLLADNPDKTYLKYLGLYKIDVYTARKAKDFDIIRYSLNRSDINPNLLDTFASLYADYREYVMVTLYNSHLEGVYTGYREFMGLLIKMFTLLQVCNRCVESVNDRKYLDDSVLHIILSMYDIPSDLIMTKEVRRNLAINLLKLVKEKGTMDVYYDLITILGYDDVVVSKLMLMKGQKFDKNNNYSTSSTDVEPYFIKLDLKESDPYEAITSDNAVRYDYHTIVDDDPTWWDLEDTRKILKESNYSIADSKYIIIEATINQMKYLFESVYFTRLIIDNKSFTDEFMVEIPEIFGTTSVSIFDLVVFLLCAACMNSGFSGEIVDEEDKLIATAGFNFDMDWDSFNEYVETAEYIDKERVMSFVENLTMTSMSDITRLFNDVICPMREWLELQITNSTTRQEYIEYESIYRALFTYDINRLSFMKDVITTPIDTIRDKYGLSESDMIAYQHFYPRTPSGKAVAVDEYNATTNLSQYNHPFIARNNQIDWYIHIVIDDSSGKPDDRGYLYFHDILNSSDVRTITNPDNTRIFMDWEDGEIGWQLNQKAVNQALSLIDALDDNALSNAYFPIAINSTDGNYHYQAGEKLPIGIRSGNYKNILKEKITMDTQGLAEGASTYFDYLRMKNPDLYELLDRDRFEHDKQAWLDDVMSIVLIVETELNLHIKYFEQSVFGSELFFKPLITLIKHFKSTFVNFAKTGLKYQFSDKIDAGGNSNMVKLFDEIDFIIHFVTLANRGFDSQLGLYDTEHKTTHHIIMNDRTQMLKMISGEGFAAEVRTKNMGSIRMVDEMKFFKNGKEIDPSGHVSAWYSGEPNIGRWSEDDDILMTARKSTERVQNMPVDLDGWKAFVESYIPE
jgi:hypothetical protein